MEKRILDRNSVLPLYYQLKEIVLEKIENGDWGIGSQIPSEKDLQERYEISRATVRQTMDILVNDGFLQKIRGKGTIVKKPAIEEKLPELKSFTEEMKAIDASKQVLLKKYVEPSAFMQKILKLYSDEKVFYLKRLMIVEGKNLGILNSYVPARYNLSLKEDYSKSLYKIFEKNDIRLAWADQTIEAAMSSKEETRILGLKSPIPILVIKRLCFSVHQEIVEYVKAVYHYDQYRFKIKLRRL
ncbi:MAG: GntR family transcriptional regulator [Desulfobacterales bacterium]|nr:MAG: GntR family transcriptional regulator [Desulfobacterales bacterium]